MLGRIHKIGKKLPYSWRDYKDNTSSHLTVDANYESINNENTDTSIHFGESKQEN